jgi:hypothetical protein
MGDEGINSSISPISRMVSLRATTGQTTKVSLYEERGHPYVGMAPPIAGVGSSRRVSPVPSSEGRRTLLDQRGRYLGASSCLAQGRTPPQEGRCRTHRWPAIDQLRHAR